MRKVWRVVVISAVIVCTVSTASAGGFEGFSAFDGFMWAAIGLLCLISLPMAALKGPHFCGIFAWLQIPIILFGLGIAWFVIWTVLRRAFSNDKRQFLFLVSVILTCLFYPVLTALTNAIAIWYF